MHTTNVLITVHSEAPVFKVLTHVIRCDEEYDTCDNTGLSRELNSKASLINIYTLRIKTRFVDVFPLKLPVFIC